MRFVRYFGLVALSVLAVLGLQAPASAAAGPLVGFYDGPGYKSTTVSEEVQLQWKWTLFDGDGVCSQQVQYYRSNVGWSGPVNVPALPTSSVTFTAPVGAYVQLLVTARDCTGAATSLYSNGRTVTLLDDRNAALSYAGTWAKKTSSNNLFSTLRTSAQTGAYFTVSRYTDHFGVVANRCPGCGTVDIYLDGVKKQRVSLASGAQDYRALVAQQGFPLGSHTLTVRVVSGSVALDGILTNA